MYAIFFQLLLTLAGDVATEPNEIFTSTSTIEIGNINCHKSCDKQNIVVCDTIALYEDGHYAHTLELPLKIISETDVKRLIECLTDSEVYTGSHKTPKATLAEAEGGCIASPTVAFVFKDKNAQIIGQMLFDLRCQHFILYQTKAGMYVPSKDKYGDSFLPFYSRGYTVISDLARKYDLQCISY